MSARVSGSHTACYARQGVPPPSRPHVDPMASSSVSCVFGILRSGSRRQLLLHERSVPPRFVAGLLRFVAVPLSSAPFRRCPVACLQLLWCCSAAFRRLACSCSVAVLSLYCYVTPRSAVIPLSYCVFPDLTVSCRWPPLIASFDICRRAGYSVRSITT